MKSQVEGTWDTTIATPVGRLAVTLDIKLVDSTYSGIAVSARETVEMEGIEFDGKELTWTQRVTKPMRLTLTFHVQVDTDTLTGTAKAGRLPASAVTGTRRVTPD